MATRLTARTLAVVLCLLCVSTVHPVAAQPYLPGATFRAQTVVNLCPEYKLGGVTAEVKYRVGNSTAYQDISPISQSVDTNTQKATFVFDLPAGYGSTPLYVAAFCRNGFGLGTPSTERAVSYCAVIQSKDTDGDGVKDSDEDTNCNGYYDPADAANAVSSDTDGDGIADAVELAQGYKATNPGDSPKRFVISGQPFDPDGDGNSNPVVFRPSEGKWYLADVGGAGRTQVIKFGQNLDIPFTYKPADGLSDVGYIRVVNNELVWNFHGSGFRNASGAHSLQLKFGVFGDLIVLGPWEKPGITNPAIARLWNNTWAFEVLNSDGSIRSFPWGINGDLPRVGDYDGDGLFDIAVYRPSEQRTYVINSADQSVIVPKFGVTSAFFNVRGDYSNDGRTDLTFWSQGVFKSMLSNANFNETLTNAQNPSAYYQLTLGNSSSDLPLSWNLQGGRVVYTVVNHDTGIRRYKANNDPNAPETVVQWGLPGDAQG